MEEKFGKARLREPGPHWQLALEDQQWLWGEEESCTRSAQQCGCEDSCPAAAS